MKIGTIDLDDGLKRVMIVAEIGNNHEGSVALAEELIGLAAEAGADAVKFQTFRTEQYVPPRDRRRFAQLRRFEPRAARTYHRPPELSYSCLAAMPRPAPFIGVPAPANGSMSSMNRNGSIREAGCF